MSYFVGEICLAVSKKVVIDARTEDEAKESLYQMQNAAEERVQAAVGRDWVVDLEDSDSSVEVVAI